MLTEVVPLEVIGISRCLVVSCFMVWLVRFRRSDENMFLFSVFLLFPLLRSEIGVIECVQVVMDGGGDGELREEEAFINK